MMASLLSTLFLTSNASSHWATKWLSSGPAIVHLSADGYLVTPIAPPSVIRLRYDIQDSHAVYIWNAWFDTKIIHLG